MGSWRADEEGAPNDTGGGRGCFWGEVRLGRSQPGGRGAGGQVLQVEHGAGGGGGGNLRGAHLWSVCRARREIEAGERDRGQSQRVGMGRFLRRFPGSRGGELRRGP